MVRSRKTSHKNIKFIFYAFNFKIMKKFLSLSCLALLLSYASFALYPMSPTSGTVCMGSYLYVSDSLSPGGVWSSSNPAVGSIDAISGAITGIASGTITITYTLGGSYVTGDFTVNPNPAPITGGSVTICATATTTLADPTPGGTWSAYFYASVGSSSGVVTGIYAGVADIYYTVAGCSAITTVTVDATTTGYLPPTVTMCLSGSYTYFDSLGLGGTWSSSNPSVATIGATTGIVTPVSGGTTTISYTTSGPCGSSVATSLLTISTVTAPGYISGTTSLPLGYTSAYLYDSQPGGTWSSTSPAVLTINATSGLITPLTLGSSLISYTYTGCGGVAHDTVTVTDTALNGISGTVFFDTLSYYGPVTVWLIKYNPTTHILSAVDSVYEYCYGSSIFYQFTGLATDSFRIKAATQDSSLTVTGFMPTYHTSYFYWHDADVIYHTSGASDINKDVHMAWGTVTAGPGFIAGDVTTGANKGTSTGAPAANIQIYVVNSATGRLVLKTFTNSAGHYSCSGLPVGATYHIFPDSLNYLTTAYSGITLTTANPGMSAASFIMHTISHTITPNMTGVPSVNAGNSEIFTFPNPASNKLKIQWNEKTEETAHVVIADLAGREVYNGSADLTQGTGVKQIDITQITNGLYLVTVSTATLSYTSKLEIAH